MGVIRDLDDLASWQALWEALASADAPARLVFKRSPTCPLSLDAEAAFERYAAGIPDDGDVRFWRVDVIARRDVARRIAEDVGVRHESPQALLLGGGHRVLWHASHGALRGDALAAAIGAGGKV